MSAQPIDGAQLRAMIAAVFEHARPDSDQVETAQHRHAMRSRRWVESLAEAFRDHYCKSDPSVRVFSKHCKYNRDEFGLNELLFDVCVCRTGTVQAARSGATLQYVSETLWQVESEFARDSKAALADFNKLVLGSAADKLFIGPLVSDVESFLQVLVPAARCCTGRVWVALLPHPADWERGDLSAPRLCQLAEQGWEAVH